MAKGKIKLVRQEQGDGFIVPDGSDPNDREASVYFRVEWLPPGTAQKGARVEFETEPGPKGLRARSLRLEGAPPSSSRPRTHSSHSRVQSHSDQDTRFINPYNFVRPLTDPRQDDRVLGSCPPPPHDRYIGLTGRITCELEAVTPLFIADAHAVKNAGGGHATYRFFHLGGQPALPATSLRGMVRSIYEMVTNSCFGVMSDTPLSKHLPPTQAPSLVPARVERSEDGWRLRLLTGTSPLETAETRPSKSTAPQYAGWLGSYWPIRPSKTLAGVEPRLRGGMSLSPTQRALRDDFIQRTRVAVRERQQRNPDHIRHGERAFALLQRFEHPSPNIGFFWDVVALRKKEADLPRAGTDQRICRGWLCVTNENIENKHSERFFFRDGNPADIEFVELAAPVRQAYETLIADYQERHAKAVKERSHPDQRDGSEPAFSRFIYEREARRLQDGDLVYAMLHGDRQQPTLEFIAPVSVPRILYRLSPMALLPEHLHHCEEYARLCPACRTFGWVYAAKPGEKLPTTEVAAYAGRVRFSHGTLQESKGTIGEKTLAILSSPKPTTTAFYLLKEENGRGAADYDTPGAQLRGRKVYRHHGDYADWTQEQRAELVSDKRSDQNRTLRDALAPGARFSFEIDFENLASPELGALLWSLELEEGMHHRVGFAKPLGFGSVRVRVTGIKIMQPKQRYSSLTASGWQKLERQAGEDAPWAKWVAEFKAAMTDLYGGFDESASMADLRALLKDPDVRRIHYPRSTPQPDADGKNFRWFVGNRRNREGHGRGEGQWLHLPTEESSVEGALWLVDEKGNPV